MDPKQSTPPLAGSQESHGSHDPEPESAVAAAAAVRAAPPTLVSTLEALTRSRLVVVDADTLLADVARLLLKPHISVVVVCTEAAAVAGVITETVLIHQFAFAHADVFRNRAGEVMLDKFHTCQPSDSLTAVLEMMQAHGLAYVLVVEPGNLPVGVLTVRDGLRALLAAGNYEEELLRSYVTGLGYQ
jgi:CBS domain-containing protein